MMKTVTSGVALCAPVLAAAQAPATTGQLPEPSNGEASDTLGEIVVTAQRRSENLQRVPVSVAVATLSQLDSVGATSVQDIKLVVPGVNVLSTGNYLSPFIRGVGSRAFGAGVENPNALYVDDVYYASQASGVLSFNNIAQIEVLKGPQGTLFGRNATGGLMQVRTRDPGSEISGAARLGYGSYDTLRSNFYLGGSLAEGVRADVALQGSWQGKGWRSAKNIVDRNDVYRTNQDIGVRSKWLFDVSETTVVRLIGDYSKIKTTNGVYQLLPNTGVAPPFVEAPNLRRYDAALNVNPLYIIKDGGVSLKVSQELGELNLASITALRKSSYHADLDIDVTPTLGRNADVNQFDRQFSQELQLLSPSGGALEWVIGGYYFNAESRYDPVSVFNFGPAVALAGPAANVIQITTESEQATRSLATFGQATYRATEALKLTVGLRYTDEKRNLRGSQTQIRRDGSSFVSVPPVNTDLTFRKLTWRFAGSYDFSPTTMAYLSYNRGFKSGGFNPSALLIPAYRPEVLDAYEGGLKLTLFDRNVRLNSSVFYYDYSDVQVQRLVIGGAATYNGAAAELYGGEVQVDARVTPELDMSVGYQYLHSKYKSFPNALVSRPSPAGGTILDSAGDATGNRLPVTPESSLNARATYTVAVGSGELALSGNLYYNSGYFAEPDNQLKQPSYVLLGASARYDLPGGRWSITLWGSNLTDKVVSNLLNSQPEGNPIPGSTTVPAVARVTWAAPRQIGATVDFKF